MTNYGRRLIVDADFERALIETMRAVQLEGLDILTRLDLREHLKRHAHHECRRYVLLQVASPDLMLRALQTDIEAGPFQAGPRAPGRCRGSWCRLLRLGGGRLGAHLLRHRDGFGRRPRRLQLRPARPRQGGAVLLILFGSARGWAAAWREF